MNIPKNKRAFCRGKACRKHQMHKVTQYKTGKASLYAQGALQGLLGNLFAASEARSVAFECTPSALWQWSSRI